jgi:hypothetical protein
VVVAHGWPISCENKCKKAIVVNNIMVEEFAKVTMGVLNELEIDVSTMAKVHII